MLRQLPYMQVWTIRKARDLLTKIATCNYCGTRAALVLKGKERHELSCSACGAPLHDLKRMPVEKEKPEPRSYAPKSMKKPKKSKYKKKKKKSFLYEAFDILEDIFD